MTDKHLDDAIDRAVREMLSGEPASDLRQRVLDDIARPSHRTIAWRPMAFGAAALAAIVLLVLNLGTRRPDVPETRIASAPLLPSAQPATPSAAPQSKTPAETTEARIHAPAAEPRATSRAGVTRARTPIPADRRVEAASIAGELAASLTSGAEPLAPVLPMAIQPIATKEIEISPITIGRIEVAPPPPRR